MDMLRYFKLWAVEGKYVYREEGDKGETNCLL
jgi:hypothetical protein